jgi:hypothetical protein
VIFKDWIIQSQTNQATINLISEEQTKIIKKQQHLRRKIKLNKSEQIKHFVIV